MGGLIRRWVSLSGGGLLVAFVALVLVAAACAPQEPVAEDPSEDPGTEQPEEEPITLGFMTPGDTNDGFFYESHLTAVQEFAEQEQWELIWVDRVPPANGLAEARNLAVQGADVVVITSPTEFWDALVEVSAEFQDVTWIGIGTGLEPTGDFTTASQDYAEIHYLAGHAFGLYLQREGGDTAGFVTGPELPFTQVVPVGLELGLRQVIEDGEVLRTYTGSFDDAGLAVEAARSQIAAGAGILYPFLGGATQGVIDEASQAEVAIAIQPEDVCEAGFAISVLFSQGDYSKAMLTAFKEGTLEMGTTRMFRVGQDPEVGVRLCDATPEEQELLDQVAEEIAAGEVIPAQLVEETLGSG